MKLPSFLRITHVKQSLAVALLLSGAAIAHLGCATGTPRDTDTGGAGGEGGSTSSSSSSSGSAGSCSKKEDCAALDDACNEGNCLNSTCAKFPRADGLLCDDGKFCTLSDACKAGVCTGQPRICPNVGPCVVGVCDLATDTCSGAPGNEGQFCVDNDPCTEAAECVAGQCVGTIPVDCSFLDDQCSFGVCDPNVGCVVQPANDGFPCNDFIFCTATDTCQSGSCVGVDSPCKPNANPCQIPSCNEFDVSCSYIAGNNGAACDDKNLCTSGEKCNNGQCNGGAPANVGSACDDNDGCSPTSNCDANGNCAGNSPILQCIAGDFCCPAACTGLNDIDCVPVELLVNGDFATDDLTAWNAANNPVNDNDTTSTFEVVGQIAQNVPSFGPSARVLTQDFVLPAQFAMATFSVDVFQNPMSPLDPQNVLIIQKDPLDQSADGLEQNAFRIDIIDPSADHFTAPILYSLYAPTTSVGFMGALVTFSVSDQSLVSFLQAHAGTALRLRIAQVESTFPWQIQIDNVSLKVQQ